jgi:hypothetical protein
VVKLILILHSATVRYIVLGVGSVTDMSEVLSASIFRMEADFFDLEDRGSVYLVDTAHSNMVQGPKRRIKYRENLK